MANICEGAVMARIESGSYTPRLNFARLQREVSEWSRRNFPTRDPNNAFTGMVEELGELAHARLKARQGIRGTAEEHRAAEIDAIGDMLIYMADYCAESKISMQETVEATWAKVSKRDWTKNKDDGGSTP